MNTRPPVTVTIITLNEEKNLLRTLQSVKWAEEVIVVDSGSIDHTLAIAQAQGVTVIHHPWSGYGQQKNFAQSKATHDWVLNIDADEVVPPELAEEIQTALAQLTQTRMSSQNIASIEGFSIPRKTFYLGRWIQYGGWYPNFLIRLVNRKKARWTEPHVHETLQVDGVTIPLTHPLHHFAFSSIHEQIVTNLTFSRLGALDLQHKGQKPSLIRLILKPIGKFFETYLLKKGILDGLPGFIISVNAAHSMFLKYAYLYEAKLKNDPI